jgi:hypothetical protein
MFKRVAVCSLFAGALLMVAPRAEAATINGSLALSAVSTAGNPVRPVDGVTGATTALGVATGLDFQAAGVASPGTAGAFQVVTSTGDFAALLPNGTLGLMDDFSFAGAGSANFPVLPTLFQASINGFTFTMTSVTINTQNNTLLDLTGTGIFTLNGFSASPGTFAFQANNSGNVFSFAGTETTVPEPGSMVLLGTGLIGLGTVLRRRFAK